VAFRPILGRGAPTLLIVGGSDEAVLRLNRQARQQLTCESKLTVIPGAAHLFEEPGALEQVAELAIGWFTRYLVPQAAGTVRPAWPLVAGHGSRCWGYVASWPGCGRG